MAESVAKHTISTEEMPYGHKAICSCGKFSLGFFTNAARAKRAMMNCSHPDDKKKEA